MEEKMATEPKWILKDLPFQNNGGIVSDNVDPTVQREYLSQITRQATIAKNSAESFMESYLIDKNLNKDHYENKIHSFLPAIPKKLNENISDENEFNMNVKDALVKTYENLQRVAVGLEEATWGELDFESNHHGRNFSPEFKQAESNLKNLLYEMRAVICDLGYEQDLKPDITRSTMPMEQRNLSQVSARYPRDWIVLREYVNNLQYIVELFDKLKDQ